MRHPQYGAPHPTGTEAELDDSQFHQLLAGQGALKDSFAALASDVRTQGHDMRNMQQVQQLHGAALNGVAGNGNNPGLVRQVDRLEKAVEAIEDEAATVRKGVWQMVFRGIAWVGAAVGAGLIGQKVIK